DAVRDLAAELIRVQAVRESTPGISFPGDTEWQHEFEAGFPFVETEDQLSAIEAVKRDMSKSRPMDRLVCGDVGFGKTEVALRAAFKAVESGRQVAVLVPTTVLAEQHLRSFRERFAGFPFRIEGLSRFRSRDEARSVLKATAKGEVDVLVGTHRLLSKDVAFSDLGLVIIDEEQRFGVEHKQRLLELRALADVLVLTATPIPRTLHMSMMELRDISTLTTPPVERRPVVTEVIPCQLPRVRRAIQREMERGGQVYILHNRVQDIQEVASEISLLVPEASVSVGHGQMPAGELDNVMRSFVQGKCDVLVSTTIIENGLDVPRANTMIVRNASRFGLAQLHQLRGRVGRSRERAFCYLMLPENGVEDPTALERLRTLERYSMLGAGFRIAMRDLEIRGAGNLLGPEQSGHILTVGYEMYCQLLEQAVSELRQEI
ncbi:MAG: DEAD/DEAH box helicase, partial [Planctomycetota bacterium]|nr:DEAD/DEAH box helicase [Planctomycetota bacterium]